MIMLEFGVGVSGLCWHVEQEEGGEASSKGLSAMELLIGECLDIGRESPS